MLLWPGRRGAYEDLLDPMPFDRGHPESPSLIFGHFVLRRNMTKEGEDETGERLIGTIGEAKSGLFCQLVGVKKPRDWQYGLRSGDSAGVRAFARGIVFVVYLTDQFFGQVFGGDDPVGAAVFVDYHREFGTCICQPLSAWLKSRLPGTNTGSA